MKLKYVFFVEKAFKSVSLKLKVEKMLQIRFRWKGLLKNYENVRN